MSINSADQPIEKLREKAIDQLIMNYGHGKLSLEAFERRLEQALDAKDHENISALTNDLELEADKEYLQKKREELGGDFVDSDQDDIEHLISIFGGSKQAGARDIAKETRMINIFGGGILDLSEAKFTSEKTKVKVLCLFGGADIIVSEDMNVISRGFCIFGGIDNRSPSARKPNSPTLTVESYVIFGGLKIRVARNLKDRLMTFGAAVRSLYGDYK